MVAKTDWVNKDTPGHTSIDWNLSPLALNQLGAEVNGKQTSDPDLTSIAGLTPANDDFIQRKAGAWTNRTVAQVKTDLGVDSATLTETMQDTVGAMVVAGTNVSVAYDDSAGTLTIASSGGGGGSGDPAATTHAATSKGTPVDADELPLIDSAATFLLKKLTWANLKAAIKSYYDTVTATLTNKTISGASNTVTNLGLSSLSATGTPSGTTYLRGDNTWATIAAGGTGDASTNTSASVDSEIALFSGSAGKTLKRATGTGIAKIASGVLGTATAGTDYATPTGTETLANKTLTNPTITNYTESVVAIGSTGTAKTIALTSGTVQTATLTGNCTFTMPTAAAGKSFMLLLNTGAGGFTATFTGVKWPAVGAPTITTTAAKQDNLSFVSDGTNWYGAYAQGYTP